MLATKYDLSNVNVDTLNEIATKFDVVGFPDIVQGKEHLETFNAALSVTSNNDLLIFEGATKPSFSMVALGDSQEALRTRNQYPVLSFLSGDGVAVTGGYVSAASGGSVLNPVGVSSVTSTWATVEQKTGTTGLDMAFATSNTGGQEVVITTTGFTELDSAAFFDKINVIYHQQSGGGLINVLDEEGTSLGVINTSGVDSVKSKMFTMPTGYKRRFIKLRSLGSTPNKLYGVQLGSTIPHF